MKKEIDLMKQIMREKDAKIEELRRERNMNKTQNVRPKTNWCSTTKGSFAESVLKSKKKLIDSDVPSTVH